MSDYRGVNLALIRLFFISYVSVSPATDWPWNNMVFLKIGRRHHYTIALVKMVKFRNPPWYRSIVSMISYCCLYGGFLEWGYTPIAGWFISWKILLKWMIWRYPCFWKPLYIRLVYVPWYSHHGWFYTSAILLENVPQISAFLVNN